YYPSRQRPDGGAENYIAIWQLSGSNTFGDNKQVNVTVRTTAKDESGNALEQDFNYAFFTGATATIQDGVIQGGTFNTGAFMPPSVKGSTPAPGRFGVSLNTPLTVEFDTPMKDPDATCGTGYYCLSNFIQLVTVSGTTETNVTSAAIDSVVLDDSKKIAHVNLKSSYNNGLLAASTQYRLKVLAGVTTATGVPAYNPLTNPQGANDVIFPRGVNEIFTTGTTSDTSAPEVNGSYPGNTETNIRTDLAVVMVSFNKDMDASTITNSTFTLTANGTSQSGTVEYRPNEDQALFKLASPLSANTTYTITLTTGIKALNGQALASNVTRTFTTAAMADTTAPQIDRMNVNDFSIVLTFTRPMNAARSTDDNWGTSVLNPAVYSLIKYGAQGFNPTTGGTAVSLTNALFEYDAMTNTVIISRLSLSAAVGQYLYLSMDADLENPDDPDGDGDNIAKDFTRLAAMTTTGNAK
ncbi:MAG: Ig-like domain-containing protein, partial [Patescibacteria group bacterium]